MTALRSPADLAEMFGADETLILKWRRQYGWPCVKVGRKVRFTQEQVEQIIARHSSAPGVDDSPAVVIGGQTKRSARRAG